jgi:adenylosuccinate synthase
MQRNNADGGGGRDAESLAAGYADVVVGGQAGSEGKGAVAAHLIRTGDYGAAVRPGSTNAGHTVYRPGGGSYVHQALPSAASVDPSVTCYMAPESSFSLGELLEEYQDVVDFWRGDPQGSWGEWALSIDPQAAVITESHRKTEADRKLGEDIGSTVHGCGAVRVEKIWRSAGDVRLAGGYDALSDFIERERVPDALAGHGRRGERVMVEGTQGTELSMNQSGHWPHATSRDCIASSFLSSCGLPPAAAGDVWAVFRTHPIRVGGNSGEMAAEEIDFETIAERAGHDEPPVEYTSVTNKKRRIFEWSDEEFERSLTLNHPSKVAITFLDYLDADNYGVQTWWGLTAETRGWVRDKHEKAVAHCGAEVALLKTGPKPEHTIDLRRKDGPVDMPPVRLPEAPDGKAEPDEAAWFGDYRGPFAAEGGVDG